MYFWLIFLHTYMRWLVVSSLLLAIVRGFSGKGTFTKRDNTLRHVTATIAHVQLMLGYILYFNSPFITYFRAHFREAVHQFDLLFFGLIHIILMTLSVVLITIGSAATKRADTDAQKFRIMAIWFLIAFIIILIAIPWPFSPLAQRPYLRSF